MATFSAQPLKGYRVVSHTGGLTRVELTGPLGTQEESLLETGGKVVVPTREIYLDVEGGHLPGLTVAGIPVALPRPAAKAGRFRYKLLALSPTTEASIPEGPASQAQTIALPPNESTVDVDLTPTVGAIDAARAALQAFAESCGKQGCEIESCGGYVLGPVFDLSPSIPVQHRRERLVYAPGPGIDISRPVDAGWLLALDARGTATNGIDRFDLFAVAEFGNLGRAAPWPGLPLTASIVPDRVVTRGHPRSLAEPHVAGCAVGLDAERYCQMPSRAVSCRPVSPFAGPFEPPRSTRMWSVCGLPVGPHIL